MTKAAELAKMGEVITNSQIGGRRNIVYNGKMQVAQRGTSQTGITASANEGYTTVDRFTFDGSTHGGAFTASQSTDAPDGFKTSLKMDCTTADTSTAAGELQMLQTRFEGQDLQQLKKGTSSAEKVTVSFYVKGNASATYMCELQDSDNSRTNGQTFAVTTSWNRIILTFVGDTSGALDNDNALSLRLNFWFNAGSTYTGGTFTSNQWTTTANERVGTITNFFDSTDREFFITGIQMEVGSVATPFEHRTFDEEMRMCQRYYYRTPFYKDSGQAANETFPCVGNMDGAVTGAYILVFPNVMRAAPTAIEQSGTSSHYSVRVTSDTAGSSGPTATGFTSEKALINLVASGAGETSGDGAFMRMENTAAFLAFSAEL